MINSVFSFYTACAILGGLLLVFGPQFLSLFATEPTVIDAGMQRIRIIWIYTVFAHFQTISSLYLLYIFSWGITGLAETLFFVVSFKKIWAGK